jgi:hypothetical protein
VKLYLKNNQSKSVLSLAPSTAKRKKQKRKKQREDTDILKVNGRD